MPEIKTVRRVPIEEDMKQLGNICYMVGYLAAATDKDWADDHADIIVEYITELFNAKRKTE